MNARILIAESDERKSDQLLRVLAPHYAVERVTNGTLAVEYALAGRAELVIAELALPEVDGHGIVQQLRADPDAKHLPIILLCDTAIDAAKGGGHEPPADDYLSRPFGSLELLTRVQSQLEMVRLRREGEDRAMRILDGVTDGFLIVDLRGRIVRYNAAFGRMCADATPGGAKCVVGSEFLQCTFAVSSDGGTKRAYHEAMRTRRPAAAEIFHPVCRLHLAFRFFPEDEGGLCILVRDLTPEKLARQALQDSEERRRLAVEAASVYDWEYDAAGKRMIYSSNVEEVLGFAMPADPAAALALIHPEDRDEVSREYGESARAGRTYFREYRILDPQSGAIIWVRSEGYHVKDASGAARFLGITQNITARKQAESIANLIAEVTGALGRLHHPAEIRQELARKVGQWFGANRCAFIEVDEAAELVRVTHDWSASSMRSREGVYRISEYISDSLREELMRGQAVAVADVRNDARTALFAPSYERDDVEAFLAAPCVVTGRWKFLLSVTRDKATAWRESDAAVLQDLATRIWLRIEQAMFEEQLHVARERLEMAMEAAQIFWWEIDLTTGHAVLSPNTSRVLGFDPPRGESAMREFVHPDDRNFIDQCLESAREGIGRLEGEFRLLAPDSRRPLWLSFQGARAPEGSDGHIRLFGITQNITERKVAESLRAGR